MGRVTWKLGMQPRLEENYAYGFLTGGRGIRVISFKLDLQLDLLFWTWVLSSVSRCWRQHHVLKHSRINTALVQKATQRSLGLKHPELLDITGIPIVWIAEISINTHLPLTRCDTLASRQCEQNPLGATSATRCPILLRLGENNANRVVVLVIVKPSKWLWGSADASEALWEAVEK